MKKLITLLLLLVSLCANSQSFDGVSISGDMTSCINQFKSKGYKVINTDADNVTLEGSINGMPIELYVFRTPKSKKVCKAVVYLNKQTTWSDLSSQYWKFYELFVNKYGKVSFSKAEFETPYELGDGYEMTAVKVEKCKYHAMWETNANLTVAVEISKYSQVKLVYENDTNMNINTEEYKELNSQRF